MQFSTKITHSFIQYAADNQVDVVPLLDVSGLSFEMCSKTESWVDAEKLECFLKLFEDDFISNKKKNEKNSIIEVVAHQAMPLKAWGVLDSVLKMIRTPKDIYEEPQRFLSYFIHPAPPVKKIDVKVNSIAFEVPFFFEEYPHIFQYLKSCFEVIALFIGEPLAQCDWEENIIRIDWSNEQSSLLTKDVYNFNPEIIQDIINTVESNQSEIRDLKSQIANKDFQLARFNEIQKAGFENVCWTSHDKKWFENQVSKLQDYFSRAHQLVTILSGADKKSKFVKEAMRKVRWNSVPQAFPEAVDSLKARLNSDVPLEAEAADSESSFKLELQ